MDEIDRKIISQLQADGRTTLEELSKITGFTSMGAKKRLENLLKKGVIKVSALINPSVLGLFPAIVMLEMESAEAMQNVLDRFEECPRVIQIFKTMGGYFSCNSDAGNGKCRGNAERSRPLRGMPPSDSDI